MEFNLSGLELRKLEELLKLAKEWCAENQWAVGLGEMALGASLISWGVQSGVIEMGSQLVATELGGANTESIVGAVGGSSIGAVAGSIIGSIGVVGMGGAIGVPAAIVLGGAAAVFGMAGYTIGDVIHNLNPFDFESFAINGSVLLVGVALVIGGARRFINDPAISSKLSSLKEKALVLNELSSRVIARSKEELEGFISELKRLPENNVEASVSSASSLLGAGLGASAGGALAAGSVTVLGSNVLGGAAISLGLVSAPLWPVIAGVAGGAGVGYAAYKAVKYWRRKPEPENS